MLFSCEPDYCKIFFFLIHQTLLSSFFSSKPNLLKQFIADLHSGKLHREFHHGPDPTDQPVSTSSV